MPAAKLITRLCLFAAPLCAALVILMRPLGRVLPYGGEITYQDTSGDWHPHIFSIDVNQGFRIAITDGYNSSVGFPAWSPDGNTLAFVSYINPYESSQDAVYRLDVNTGEILPLTVQPASTGSRYFESLAWSPDGGQLALVGQLDGNWGYYVADVENNSLRLVTEGWMEGGRPVWSPDGSQLAFSAYTDDSLGLHIVNADGSSVRFLSGDLYRMYSQAWSSDGHQLVFTDIYLGITTISVDESVSSEQQITDYGDLPAWSPDGMRIAFARNGYAPAIYAVNPDGSDLRLLVETEFDVNSLAWSPDSRRLAFQVECDFGGEYIDVCLYVMDADGSNLRRLAIYNDPDYAGEIVWRP